MPAVAAISSPGPQRFGHRQRRGLPPFLLLGLVLLGLAGCASAPRPCDGDHRPFVFGHDSFSYENELVWEYAFDDAGRWKGRPRQPPPTYSHHCFVVARSAKQFFLHARFDPDLPRADERTYPERVRQVVRASPRRESAAEARHVIPGYADLGAFSRDWKELLQQECGSYWQSYFQRGHWRMIFPFSRHHQHTTARRLTESLARGHVTVVHLVAFPSLRINHAVLVIGFTESPAGYTFAVYDPNRASAPTTLSFDRASRSFSFPVNPYYPGGRLDVYEVYSSGCY